MTPWQLQDAKARFSEFVERALKDGPQVVSRRGVETAVLISISEWRRLRGGEPRSLKSLLLAKEPRFENLAPPRGKLRRRPPLPLE